MPGMDHVSKRKRSEIMQAVRSKGSRMEVRFGSALRAAGLRFSSNVRGMRGTPDIVFKKYRVVVFLDSCFWHGCRWHCNMPKTNKRFWEKKIERNKKRDRSDAAYYRKHGWSVFRIWGHRVERQLDDQVERVVSAVNERKRKKP